MWLFLSTNVLQWLFFEHREILRLGETRINSGMPTTQFTHHGEKRVFQGEDFGS